MNVRGAFAALVCALGSVGAATAASAAGKAADAGEQTRAPDAGFARRFVIPGQLRAIQVGDGPMVFDGLPMRLTAVSSSWKWQELESYFLAEFRKAGLWIPPRPPVIPGLAAPVVVGLDVDRMIHHTLILTPEPDGTTTVMIGESYLSAAQKPGAVTWAPTLPGATNLLSAHLEVAESFAYLAPGTPAKAIEFYRQRLGKDGYQELEDGLFTRGDLQLRVRIQDASDAGVRVSVIRRRVDQAESTPDAP